MGPNTGALAPRVRPKAGLGVGCGRGSEKLNSDAESCILVTTCCKISCFLKTTAKKLGGGNQYIVGPQPKIGDQFPPVPMVVAPMTVGT